jgi:hypothetical protein
MPRRRDGAAPATAALSYGLSEADMDRDWDAFWAQVFAVEDPPGGWKTHNGGDGHGGAHNHNGRNGSRSPVWPGARKEQLLRPPRHRGSRAASLPVELMGREFIFKKGRGVIR